MPTATMTCLCCGSELASGPGPCQTCHELDLTDYVILVRRARSMRSLELSGMSRDQLAALRRDWERTAQQLTNLCRVLGLTHSDANEFKTADGVKLVRLTPDLWTDGTTDFRSCPATQHPIDANDHPIAGAYVSDLPTPSPTGN